MSQQDAKRLIQDLHTNAVLVQQINSAAENIVKAAAAAGYQVTLEEVSAALKDHWQIDDPDCNFIRLSEAPGY
jgi:predicted ribosomally synthesized peptide with nif11-like leader